MSLSPDSIDMDSLVFCSSVVEIITALRGEVAALWSEIRLRRESCVIPGHQCHPCQSSCALCMSEQ